MKRTAAHKSVHIRWIEFERIEDRLIGVRLGSIDTFSKRKKMKRLKKLSIKEKPRQREIWIQDNAKKKWNPVQLGKTT